MKTKHTPAPWKVRELKGRIAADIVAESGRQIALMTEHYGDEPMTPMSQFVRSEQDKADAEFIVRAVNCHDELIESLEVIEAMRSELNQDVESDRIIERQIKKLMLILKRAKGGAE